LERREALGEDSSERPGRRHVDVVERGSERLLEHVSVHLVPDDGGAAVQAVSGVAAPVACGRTYDVRVAAPGLAVVDEAAKLFCDAAAFRALGDPSLPLPRRVDAYASHAEIEVEVLDAVNIDAQLAETVVHSISCLFPEHGGVIQTTADVRMRTATVVCKVVEAGTRMPLTQATARLPASPWALGIASRRTKEAGAERP